MSLSRLLQALVHRWYATLIGVVATAALCGLALQLVPAKQTVMSEMLLLPPASALGKAGNVYLSLGGLDGPADVLAKSVKDASTQASLKNDGVLDDYTVVPDIASSGPMIVVTVEGTRKRQLIPQMTAVIARTTKNLEALQRAASVPANSYITTTVITQDTKPTISYKPQVRALIVAGALGAGATLALVALLESFSERPRRRRRPAAGVIAAEPQVDEDLARPDRIDSMQADDRTPISPGRRN